VKRAIRRYRRDFLALTALVAIAVAVVGYILVNQRLYLPGWVPVIGTDFYEITAEFSTGQAVASGQGQSVNVAGVPVGEIGDVELRGGTAHLTLLIKRRYAPVYRDASALLRPKTALKDMTVELDRGTPAAGEIPDNGTLSIAATAPDINLDEILSSLDGDTRDYLVVLLTAGDEALAGDDTPAALRATLKRLAPTNRDLARITRLLARRRERLEGLIHNLSLLTGELGRHDRQLAELVGGANATFGAIASQDARLAESIGLLPGTLSTARTSLLSAGRLADRLGPTLDSLRPAARGLGPALQQARPFLRTTTPTIRDELRPFAREAQPPVQTLARGMADLRPAAPQLTRSLRVVNDLLDQLAYNPPGPEEGYLFWLAWGGHNAASLFSTQDAHGAFRRGLIITSCQSLSLLETIAAANDQLQMLSTLTNLPKSAERCPGAAAAKRGER
jgi:phospholipid/cholesterol/gamma-HCH transport system substrate-binding protein